MNNSRCMSFRLSRILVSAIMLIMTAQSSWAQAVADQEAFYIYRNDGEFNGFFYEDVVRISYSKVDVDGVEKPNYVVQEVETKDSLYRIPLSVIDSVGFEQPEIKMASNFYDLELDDCPYQGFKSFNDHYEICWGYIWGPSSEGADDWVVQEKYIPKVGDILRYRYWFGQEFYESGPFVGKVVKVETDSTSRVHPDIPEYGYWNAKITCEPITDLSEVFEQLITVERVDKDNGGYYYSRVAGNKSMKPQWDGNKEINMVSITGSFPFSHDGGKWNAGITVDLSTKVSANIAYNISKKSKYINIDVKEDATISAKLYLQGVLEDVLNLPIAGVPIPFPSFFPILELHPSPGAFMKASGTIDASVSTPQFGFHGSQSLHIGDDGIKGTGSCSFGKGDTSWGMELSLNGSMHLGANFPFKVGTLSWAKKALYCEVGAEMYVGPKFEAHFTLDPVALVGKDVYNTFKSTTIAFTPIAAVMEMSAKASAGESGKSYKFFEAENAPGKMQLSLFPSFSKVSNTRTIEWGYEDGFYSTFRDYWEEEVHVKPRGNSVPFYIGMCVANAAKEVIYANYEDEGHGNEWRMYSFFQTFDDMKFRVRLMDGTYYIMPVIKVFNMDVPVWDAATTVSVDRPISVENYKREYRTGTIVVKDLINSDKVTIEQVGDDERFIEFGEMRWLSQASRDRVSDLHTGSEWVLQCEIPFTNSSKNTWTDGKINYFRIKAVRDGRVRYSNPFSFPQYSRE